MMVWVVEIEYDDKIGRRGGRRRRRRWWWV